MRRAVEGIARYVAAQKAEGARVIVGRDPRFLGETFVEMAAKILASHGITPLVITDPDLPGGGTFVHWAAWHLPRTGVPEQTLPAGVVQGKNSIGNAAYAGPCPPAGSPAHHYVFTVSAVSKQITLAPGATADELRAAIKGNVLAQGKLTGTYQRSTGAQ